MNDLKPILIIDDDRDVRETLAEILITLGHHVQVAQDGRHALEVIKRIGEPSLIFLDGMMPIMDGSEFYASYRKLPGHEHVPVVLFSATGEKYELEGLSGKLRKPAELDEILQFVEKHCGKD